MSAGPLDLRGLRVLLTRPGEQGAATERLVAASGGRPLWVPCLFERPAADLGPLDEALAQLGQFRLLVLTSQSAARVLLARLRARGQEPAEALRGLQVVAVGAPTAAVLTEAQVTLTPLGAGTGAQMAEELLRRRAQDPGQAGAVLFPRAQEGREELLQALRDAAVPVRAVVAYEMAPARPDQLAPAVAALRRGEVDLVPLGSPRSAAVLLQALAATPEGVAALLGPTLIGAIGPTTAAALREAGVAAQVEAPRASFPELLAAMAEAARAAKK